MTPDKKRPQGGTRLQQTQKEQRPSGRRPQRTGAQTAMRALFITATVLAAIIVTLFVVYKLVVVKPNIPTPPNLMDTTDRPLPTGDNVDPDHLDVEGPKVSGDRKKDFYTFLVIGRDTGGGGNTDTIMLVAYDIPNQKLAVMNIPRDTMVNIPYDIKRINAVYNYYGGGEKGIQALYKEVSQLVGFQPDFDVVVEWDGFGKLVDAIGGVDFNVPLNMNYDDPTQNLHIHINKGMQHLNGKQAMQVIRFRMNNDNTGYATGDIGRIETQQAFMKAVIAQCLQIKNVTKIGEFAKIFTECVDTDLTVNNLAYFGEQAILGGLTMENVMFITMPGNYNASAWSRNYNNYQSYVLPYGSDLIEVVNEHFNPYLKDITARQLDIMSVNRDGSLSSSTGAVEDGKATRAPVVPTKQPTQTREPEPDVTKPPETSETPKPTPDTIKPSATPSPTPSTGPTAGPGSEPTTAPPVPPAVGPTEPPAVPTATAPVESAPVIVEPTTAPTLPPPAPTTAPTQDPGGVVLPPEAENG